MNQRQDIQLPSAPIQANVDLLIQREITGLAKYGVTLGDADLTHAQLLQHGLEEALDLANYLQTALSTERENARYKAEHLLLLEQLYLLKRRYVEGYLKSDFEDAFLDLLTDYEIDATRRGIRLCPSS